MEHHIMTLKDVIQQELTVYTEILAKAKQKKEALMKNDVAVLDRIVALEWKLLKSIKQLETQREGLISEIEKAGNYPQNQLHLSDIADMLEGGLRSEFAELREQLMQVISELTALNTVNKGLVSTHLQYSNFCVNLLTGHVNSLNTYSPSGQMSETKDSATLIFDRMV